MALFVEQYELSKGLFEPKMAGGRLWRNFFREVGGKRACRPLFAPAAPRRRLTMTFHYM